MDCNIIKEIDLDFYNRKNVIVEAKQYDRLSRYVLVTCYNQGSVFRLDSSKHFVFIRYKKSDENGVFNSCTITEDGKILAELTEQMIAVSGNCYADIVVTTGDVTISDNGELKDISNGTIVSTMNFCVHVIPTALDNSEIESSYEFNALDDLIAMVTKDYKYVMENAQQSADHAAESEQNAKDSENNAAQSAKAAATSEANAKTSETNAKKSETSAKNSATTATNKAKEASDFAIEAESYAHGGTGTRTGEDTDNGLYYKNQSANSESAAKTSETNAKTSETNAANSASTATTKANAASTSATNAATSATTASTKASEAEGSASNAAASATTAAQKAAEAGTSETNAANSATSAANSATTASNKADAASMSATNAANSASTATNKATSASTSASNAATSATNADTYAKKSQSYAVGGTGTRTGENTDNSKYYYEQAKSISESIAGALRPMGTVTFANLPALSAAVEGDMYNISDQFTTTADFKEDSGLVIPAGSNVYKTADNKWDVLAGSPVTGVKGNSETAYRKGNVNITKSHIGLGSVDNTADADKNVASAKLLAVQSKNWKQGTDLPSTYPSGETIFYSSKPTDMFNNEQYCTIHTIKPLDNPNGIQFLYPYNKNIDKIYFREALYNTDEWRDWHEIITSANIGSQSVASAANADKIDGYHISVVSALPSDAASHTDTLYII